MNPQSLSLVHLLRAPAVPSPRPPLLALAHGVGSNERDLFSLAGALDPRFLIVSLRAPHSRGPDAYAWFNINVTPDGPVSEPGMVEASRQAIITFLGEAVAAYGADPARVYLLGFSQGAIMSVAVALTRPDLLAGAALLSGRTPFEALDLSGPPPTELAGLPIFLAHGTHDATLPLRYGHATRATLAGLPVALDYHEYPGMDHGIGPRELDDLAAWLTAQLDGPRRAVPTPPASSPTPAPPGNEEPHP